MPETPTPDATDPNADDPNADDPNADDPSVDPLLPTTPPTGDEQQETVTIEQGDHKISVTSPDGQGQVTVTVDDGSGTPKTYNLNFGGPDAAVGPGPGQAPPTQGPPGSDAAPGVPGSDGEALQPGPDGKCVIEDGDLKITAERPEGQPDTVLVTVDNGTGEPTSYNLDYSNPSGATTLPAPAPGEFRTMPAEQEMVTGRPMPVVEPGAIPQQEAPVAATQAAAEQYGATSPQATGSLSNDNVGGDAGLSRATDSGGGDAGLSRANDSEYADVGQAGEAGLSSAEDTGGGHAQTGMAGGMPMLGGAGGGAGSGEDQQRTTTQWKTTGDLFDDGTDARMSDIFGERR